MFSTRSSASHDLTAASEEEGEEGFFFSPSPRTAVKSP